MLAGLLHLTMTLGCLQAPPPNLPAAAVRNVKEPAMPHAFDFWIGIWEVRAKDGTLLGHNRVEALLEGIILQEHWRGAKGGAGTSLNAFMPSKGLWRQTWVDQQGQFLDLEGALEGHQMVLRGTTSSKEGPVAERITWTPLADGRVRQLWEQSHDEGTTWTVAFEGFYARMK